MLFLTWINSPFTQPQNKNSWLPNIEKGQTPILSLWEVRTNPTANIPEQWLATVSLGCLCDASLICHYCLFPTWINVCSPHQTTPPWEGDTSSLLLPGSAHSLSSLMHIPQAHIPPLPVQPASLSVTHCNTIWRAGLRVMFWCKAKVVHHLGLGLVNGNDRSPVDLMAHAALRKWTIYSNSVLCLPKKSINKQTILKSILNLIDAYVQGRGADYN